MKPAKVADRAEQELEWVTPMWGRAVWELREGSELLGTLRRKHWWGSGMVAEVDSERWQLAAQPFQAQMTAWRGGDDDAGVSNRARPAGRADASSGVDDPPAVTVRSVPWRGEDRAPNLGVRRWRGDQRLELASGETLWFRRPGLWNPEWHIVDADGNVWITALRPRLRVRSVGSTRIERFARQRPEIALLTMIAWWLVLNQSRKHAHY